MQSWNELEQEVKKIFKDDRIAPAGSFERVSVIINELKNNSEHYIENPKDFNQFFLKDKEYFSEVAYLTGYVALLSVSFYDKEGNKLSKSQARQAVNSDDENVKENTFIVFEANPETLKKFNQHQETKKLKM